MNDVLQFVVVAATLWSLFAFMGAFVAQAKGRPAFEGVVFGFLLGPFGLLITALMPTIRKPKEPKPVAAEPKSEPRSGRTRRRIGTEADDKAMDFLMGLVREQDDGESRSIRRDG